MYKLVKDKEIDVIVSKEDVDSVSDFNIEKWYDGVLGSSDRVVRVGNGVMLDRLRAGVVVGELKPFKTVFNNVVVEMAENSQLSQWPKGMFDQHEKIVAAILGW